MNKERALRASACLVGALWLALTGCSGMGGTGSSGCGGMNPNAQLQPNCSQGYYAQQNSDGSYGACQPIPNGSSNANAGTTTTKAGP